MTERTDSAVARGELLKLAGFAALGALSGVAAKIADESTIGWLSDLGTYAGIWVLVLALVARLAPTAPAAALRATALFVAMSIAYYAWSAFVLGFGGGPFVIAWAALACTIVPAVAFAVRWASAGRGILPGALLAAAAGIGLADGTLWQLWWASVEQGAPEGFPLRPVQAAANLVVALVITILLPQHGRTRAWALLLLVPATIVVGWILDAAYGFIGAL